MLSSALCLWKERFSGQNEHASFGGISGRNGAAGNTTFLEVPRELPLAQRKLINVNESLAKINRDQQSLWENIKLLFHIEFIVFKTIFLGLRKNNNKKESLLFFT